MNYDTCLKSTLMLGKIETRMKKNRKKCICVQYFTLFFYILSITINAFLGTVYQDVSISASPVSTITFTSSSAKEISSSRSAANLEATDG